MVVLLVVRFVLRSQMVRVERVCVCVEPNQSTMSANRESISFTLSLSLNMYPSLYTSLSTHTHTNYTLTPTPPHAQEIKSNNNQRVFLQDCVKVHLQVIFVVRLHFLQDFEEIVVILLLVVLLHKNNTFKTTLWMKMKRLMRRI